MIHLINCKQLVSSCISVNNLNSLPGFAFKVRQHSLVIQITVLIVVHQTLFGIEQMIINTVLHYGIVTSRDTKNAGVWLDVGKKINEK